MGLLSMGGNATGISGTHRVLTSYPSKREVTTSLPQLQNEVVMHTLPFAFVLCWRRGDLGEQRWKSRHLSSSAASFGGNFSQDLAGQVGICSPGADKPYHCSLSVPEDLLSNCIPSRTRETL